MRSLGEYTNSPEFFFFIHASQIDRSLVHSNTDIPSTMQFFGTEYAHGYE